MSNLILLICHCEKRSDVAISTFFSYEIAALPLVARNDILFSCGLFSADLMNPMSTKSKGGLDESSPYNQCGFDESSSYKLFLLTTCGFDKSNPYKFAMPSFLFCSM